MHPKTIMHAPSIVFVLLSLVIGAGCSNAYTNKLNGNWQGIEVLEMDKPLDVDASVIRFRFADNQYYEYFGTLNYREAGMYYLESKYLFTTDTVNMASTEKVVEIVKLNGDTLFLKMNENGRERILKLVKTQ